MQVQASWYHLNKNHISYNLCLYCGASGHKASDCPHAKAKAACASESGSKPKDLAPEQKKGFNVRKACQQSLIKFHGVFF